LPWAFVIVPYLMTYLCGEPATIKGEQEILPYATLREQQNPPGPKEPVPANPRE
jgi:hypothetical protein